MNNKKDELLDLPNLLLYSGLSVSTVYKYMKTKDFPKPTKIGHRVYWKEQNVLNWLTLQFRTGEYNALEI